MYVNLNLRLGTTQDYFILNCNHLTISIVFWWIILKCCVFVLLISISLLFSVSFVLFMSLPIIRSKWIFEVKYNILFSMRPIRYIISVAQKKINEVLARFELATFCVYSRRDNHYTTEPDKYFSRFYSLCVSAIYFTCSVSAIYFTCRCNATD